MQISLKRKNDDGDFDNRRRFAAPDARILVVDDTEANLVVSMKLLRRTGVSLDTAKSGEAALQKTRNNSYDLIFMDHMMPEMDGIECLHRIRAQAGGKSREAKVVAFTANADDENRLLYEREGFNGYLVKPVTGKDLEQQLLSLLPEEKLKFLDEEDEPGEESGHIIREYDRKASVAITTDSICGLSMKLKDRYRISEIPYLLVTEEGNFRDKEDIGMEDALAYKAEGKRIRGRSPSVEDYEIFFADALTQANNIIHISADLDMKESGFANAVEAAGSFDNVIVVDCGHLSAGQAYMAKAAGRMAAGGMTAADILNRLNGIKESIQDSFMAGNGARSQKLFGSRSMLFLATRAFMMAPFVSVLDRKLFWQRFYIGRGRKVWEKYIASSLSLPLRIDSGCVYVTYSGMSASDLDWIRDEILKRVPFKKVVLKRISPALAIGCGPGSFGIMYRWKNL